MVCILFKHSKLASNISAKQFFSSLTKLTIPIYLLRLKRNMQLVFKMFSHNRDINMPVENKVPITNSYFLIDFNKTSIVQLKNRKCCQFFNKIAKYNR